MEKKKYECYTPFPKKIKYMINSPLSVVGSCKSKLVKKSDLKPKRPDFHTVRLRIHHFKILIFFKPMIPRKHSL